MKLVINNKIENCKSNDVKDLLLDNYLITYEDDCGKTIQLVVISDAGAENISIFDEEDYPETYDYEKLFQHDTIEEFIYDIFRVDSNLLVRKIKGLKIEITL